MFGDQERVVRERHRSLAQDRFKIGNSKEATPFGCRYWSSADIGLSMSDATWRGPVNKAITALALATLIVSPALAQSYEPEIGSGNIAHPHFAQPFPPDVYLGNRFAPARRGRNGSTYRVHPYNGGFADWR